MTRHVLPLLAVAALAACADSPVQPTPASPTNVNLAVSNGSLRHVVDFNGAIRGDFAARVAALGGTVDFVAEGAGFAAVSGLTAQSAAALGKVAGIGSVFEDEVVQLSSTSSIEPMSDEISPTSIANPAAAIAFSRQWNMRAVRADAAWAGGNLGSAGVTIAILDSGLDYDNLDLNGMVDLARSVSFVASDNALINAFFPGRNPIDDFNGHGTNVATQASSNGTAFAGVNSRARLIGVKVLGASGSGSIAGILAGILAAADNGADVANMSVGIANGVDKAGSGQFVGITNRVLNYAHRKGMVVVVSAGNDAKNLDNNGRSYAAYCEAPHVICVSALGPATGTSPFTGPWTNVDAGASYSNTGRKSITVSAPGGSARGYVQSLCARHLIAVSGQTASFPCNAGLLIYGAAGTSQAAPHVTGIVAQMIAKYGKLQPSQIKHLLLQSLDDLGPPGPDDVYGAGRVNLVKALSH